MHKHAFGHFYSEAAQQPARRGFCRTVEALKKTLKYLCTTNLHAESDALHDEDSVRKDCSHFLHAGKVLDGIPDVSIFIQQLELSWGGRKMEAG